MAKLWNTRKSVVSLQLRRKAEDTAKQLQREKSGDLQNLHSGLESSLNIKHMLLIYNIWKWDQEEIKPEMRNELIKYLEKDWYCFALVNNYQEK